MKDISISSDKFYRNMKKGTYKSLDNIESLANLLEDEKKNKKKIDKWGSEPGKIYRII